MENKLYGNTIENVVIESKKELEHYYVANSNTTLVLYNRKTKCTMVCFAHNNKTPILNIEIIEHNEENVPLINLCNANFVYNFEDNGDKFYLIGGRLYIGNIVFKNSTLTQWINYTSVWCFSQNKNTKKWEWCEYPQSISPKQSCDFSICYSEILKSFVIFGGFSYDNDMTKLENSIWFFSTLEKKWIIDKNLLLLSFTTNIPQKRRNCLISCHNYNVLIFSGNSETNEILYDTWLLNFDYNNINFGWKKIGDQTDKETKNNFDINYTTLYYDNTINDFIINYNFLVYYKFNKFIENWEIIYIDNK